MGMFSEIAREAAITDCIRKISNLSTDVDSVEFEAGYMQALTDAIEACKEVPSW